MCLPMHSTVCSSLFCKSMLIHPDLLCSGVQYRRWVVGSTGPVSSCVFLVLCSCSVSLPPFSAFYSSTWSSPFNTKYLLFIAVLVTETHITITVVPHDCAKLSYSWDVAGSSHLISRPLLLNTKTNLQAGQGKCRQILVSPDACIRSRTQSQWPSTKTAPCLLGCAGLLCVVCSEEQSLLFVRLTSMQIYWIHKAAATLWPLLQLRWLQSLQEAVWKWQSINLLLIWWCLKKMTSCIFFQGNGWPWNSKDGA